MVCRICCHYDINLYVINADLYFRFLSQVKNVLMKFEVKVDALFKKMKTDLY
jgi:hypothetical protein